MTQDMDSSPLEREGTPVRDYLEAAVASHSHSPDVDSVVSGAIEHDRAIRHRDRAKPVDHFQHAGTSSAQLRSTIRGALHENKLKIAAPPTQSAKPHEVAPGAPKSWSLDARASWSELPQETRLAI